MNVKKISTFNLKIIAITAMLIDHIALVLNNHNIIAADLYLLMRGIGRISFPLFAFMLVTGFQKTHDKTKYFINIMMFAGISQIPYTMSNNRQNAGSFVGNTDFSNIFSFSVKYFIVCAVIVVLYSIISRRNVHKVKNTVIVGLSLLISGITYSHGGFIFLNSSGLNVFYSLAIGLLVMHTAECAYNDLKGHKISFDGILLCMTAILIVYAVGKKANYGYYGTLLILGLYMLKKHLNYQAVYAALWALLYTQIAVKNVFLCICTMIASVFIYLYNGNKGKSMKYVFYAIYPVHLLIMGIINLAVFFWL